MIGQMIGGANQASSGQLGVAQGRGLSPATTASSVDFARLTTVHDALVEIRERVGKLHDRARSVADHVLGSEPEKNPSSGEPIATGGLSGSFLVVFTQVAHNLQELERQLCRIERVV